MTELKPCPFCGSPAYKTKAPDIAKFTVCSNSRCFLHKSDWIPKSAWENRPIEDKLKAENERLREGLQKIYNLVNDSNTEYAVQLVITMQDEAQQALNEETINV